MEAKVADLLAMGNSMLAVITKELAKISGNT